MNAIDSLPNVLVVDCSTVRPGKLWRYGLCVLGAVIGSAVRIFHQPPQRRSVSARLDALASMDEK